MTIGEATTSRSYGSSAADARIRTRSRTGPRPARVAKAVGLEISGVDMIFRGFQPYVLEVNASSGFRGLLEATGINAADAMVDYAVAKAKASGRNVLVPPDRCGRYGRA